MAARYRCHGSLANDNLPGKNQKEFKVSKASALCGLENLDATNRKIKEKETDNKKRN